MNLRTLLRSHLTLPVIIGSLPYNIQNGDAVDAIPVMADFNFIVSQVNANVPLLTTVPLTVYAPTVGFGGASVGVTYSVQAGAYARLGSMVFFTLDIVLSSKGSSTGSLQIGLPLAVNAGWPTGGLGSMGINVKGVTFSGGSGTYCTCSPSPGNSYLVVRSVASAGSGAFMADTECTNASQFSVTGMYSV